MLGEIAWAIVCFGAGWACRGKFGSVGEMYRHVKTWWEGVSSKKTSE